MKLSILISVALGGALGSVLRYSLVTALQSVPRLSGFPLGTLSVNVIGSFAMGVFVAMVVARNAYSSPLAAFLLIGLCGGFTTFSAFSMDAVRLVEAGALGVSFVYMGVSVVLSILSLIAGLWLVRMVL